MSIHEQDRLYRHLNIAEHILASIQILSFVDS
jgi:hypothetical protein